MHNSYYANPVEIIHTITLYSFLDTLSDFLFAENLLAEKDLYKPIPIANAFNNYLDKYEDDEEKIRILTYKLLIGSQLYGAKNNETLSPQFVDSLFTHVISCLVFKDFGNIYRFLAVVFLNSPNDEIMTYFQEMRNILHIAKFDNEYGEPSSLDSSLIQKIIETIIMPLFPTLKPYNTRVLSVDYIYAQAGLMFVRSDKIFPNYNITRTPNHFHLFDEFQRIGQTIEQLVLAGKLDVSTLRIFALPALLFYVRNSAQNFSDEDLRELTYNTDDWKKAYTMLFFYLKKSFKTIEKAENIDVKYQFHLALSNYKNRTTLAHQMILKSCPTWYKLLKNDKIQNVLENYKNHPENFKCAGTNESKLLPNINDMFQKQNKLIQDKYFLYEKESIRQAFGDDLIKSLDNVNVSICTGLKGYVYDGSLFSVPESFDVVNSIDDLFVLYFSDNDTALYYALIRDKFNMTLIKESDNPQLFRKKLDLDSYSKDFFVEDFPDCLMKNNENFDNFSTNLAKMRAKQFRKQLYEEGYDQTWMEWWKEIGLSFIPFYSCVTDSMEEEYEMAFVECSIDLTLLLPVIGEVGNIATKIISEATQTALLSVGTNLRTTVFRASLKNIIELGDKMLTDIKTDMGDIITKNMFQNLGKAVFHLIDPGFELAYVIGKKGINSMEGLIRILQKIFSIPLEFISNAIINFRNVLNGISIKIGEKFGRDVYVNSLDKTSGYGYKFIILPDDTVAELRSVKGVKEEIPVVLYRDIQNHQNIYKQVDVGETWWPTGQTLYEENKQLAPKSVEGKYSIDINRRYNEESYCFELKTKRSPKTSLCFRSERLQEKLDRENEAVAIAVESGKFSEEQIRSSIREYYFPDEGKNEIDFVKDWATSENFNIPTWAEEYQISEPEEFFKLMYDKELDYQFLTEDEAKFRIKFLYSIEDRQHFQVKSLLEEYEQSKAYLSVTFEDFVALASYQGKTKRMAHLTLSGNSDLSRRMRYALNRLAIRQIEEDITLFSSILYRGEIRELDTFNDLFQVGRKEFILLRYTATSRDLQIAEIFRTVPDCEEEEFVRVLYEFSFPQNTKYLRARIENIVDSSQSESVLMPYTYFKIQKVERSFEDGKNFAKVKLMYLPHKIEAVKDIMNHIEDLKHSGTIFTAPRRKLSV